MTMTNSIGTITELVTVAVRACVALPVPMARCHFTEFYISMKLPVLMLLLGIHYPSAGGARGAASPAGLSTAMILRNSKQ